MEMNEDLERVFTREEVEVALFQIGPLKSPSSDGYGACFYQDLWKIVGEDTTTAILRFLNDGLFAEEINYTHIALIPKLENPKCVTDFRPINLCNVLYKIIAKMLANRLKNVLPEVISYNQSAFIPCRLVKNNIMLVYKSLHTMKSGQKGKEWIMALKFDMSKAYDRVE